MNFKIVHTSSSNIDFKLLVAELDAHLAEFYGDEQAFFSKHNVIDAINNVVVVYNENMAIGCGGIKAYTTDTMEIKRMYVKPAYRGKGIASAILKALENWAVKLDYSFTVLETLKIKKDVISMYAKNGYHIIPNYGQYKETTSSICMRKNINLPVADS
jgi:putative acetyltransferase